MSTDRRISADVNTMMEKEEALAPIHGTREILSVWKDRLRAPPGVMTNHLIFGLSPSVANRGEQMGMRSERDMRIPTKSLSAILAGDLGSAGDSLVQLTGSCENNLLDGNWEMYRHFEVFPFHQISCGPIGLRQVKPRKRRLADKLRHGSGSSRREDLGLHIGKNAEMTTHPL